MAGRRKRHLIEETLAAAVGGPDLPVWAIPAALGGVILGNFAYDLTATFWEIGLSHLVPFLAGIFCIGLSVRWRKQLIQKWKNRLGVEFTDVSPRPVKALILPVSTPTNIPPPLVASAEQQIDQPVSPEEEALLNATNLKPALAALEYHWGQGPDAEAGSASRLQEVWLVATEETGPQGQRIGSAGGAAALLERWFFSRHPEARSQVTFHRDEYEGISLRVGSRNYTQLWNVVDHIYTKAPYKPEQILADITPGTKVMSVAIALACLPPKRRMQYMVAHRDPQTGGPLREGVLRPMLIDIDPYLEEEEE